MKKKTVHRNFLLYTDRQTGGSPSTGDRILLYPFKNLSVQPFSFPFNGMPRVRDALKIRFRPLLGEKAEEVSLVPLLTKSEKKLSSGATFLLHGEDSEKIETLMDGGGEALAVWPVPLAFAAEVGGSGLIVWSDEEQIISLWLEDWVPMLYRWSDRRENTVEGERKLVEAYAAGQNATIERVFTGDPSSVNIQACGESTLSAYSPYEHLDLSNKGANLLEQRERFVGQLAKAARFALAGGLVFALASGALFLQQTATSDSSSSLPGSVYTSAFGERSGQPLVSIRQKLAQLQGTGQDTSLQGFLKTLAPIWEELTPSGNIVVETMKYSLEQEKADLLGTAKNSNAIQDLRTLLEKQGFSLKTDNIQQIPGGGVRFNVSITKGAKS